MYSSDGAAVRSGLNPVAASPNTDSFAVDRRTWDIVLPQAMDRLNSLAEHDLSPAQFRNCVFRNDLPRAYENAILIAAADSARRRGWHDLAADSSSRCTNPVLVELWSRWQMRWVNSTEQQSRII
jgi:hypothetical protein